MARRRRSTSTLDLVLTGLSHLHWALLLGTGVVVAALVRNRTQQMDSPVLRDAGLPLDLILAAPAWVALVVFAALAYASFSRARTRARLLANHATIEQVARMSWADFERLVGQAYRAQGFSVLETGLGGADGGIDLVLSRGGKKTLVQCKHWKSRSVGAPTVREMWGLAHHHGAAEVKIVSVGAFTPAARAFARGKPIELVGGSELTALLARARFSGSIRAHHPVP